MDAELASKPIAAGGGAWAGSALRFSPAHTGLHYAAADAAPRAGRPRYPAGTGYPVAIWLYTWATEDAVPK